MRIKDPNKQLVLGFSTSALVLGVVAFSLLAQRLPVFSSSLCEPQRMSTYSAIGWAKEPFDGDDAPYKAIKREIDALAAKGNDTSKLAALYKNTAQQTPKDAEAQFRWGYAAFLASDYVRHIPANKSQVLCGVYVAMGQPKNPQSFEYTRLRFIVGKLYSRYGSYRQMNELGIRLLNKAAKDDFALRYFGINALSTKASQQNSEPLERCLKLTLELQKDFPKRTEPIRMLGGINSSLFAITKKTDFADQALQYYQQYLQILPLGYEEWRKYVERSIKETKMLKESYNQRGELKS